MSTLQNKVFKLKGKVQHYAWGGYQFIPKWLGIENKDHEPYAEYWMGAHPSASSVAQMNGDKVVLYDLIKQDPRKWIGEKTFRSFGELPYLFKILDVKDMLSIQVHPAKEEAAKGFEAEERAGISIDAPQRNYKDKNHKPEVMVALSEFWLLHGFRVYDKMVKILETISEFAGFDRIFSEGGYKGLYQHVMQMPQQSVNELLTPLVKRELKRKDNGELTQDQPGWWVTKLFEDGNVKGDIDRGVFSIYFFNIVRVNPGEAIFQGAGIPHAYLEGQNVELMANSDNVLRGGLTPKHVDVPELMKHTLFEGITPNVMKGKELNEGEKNYPCPVPDFGINKIELKSGDIIRSIATSFEIIVIINGEIKISGSNTVIARRGEVVAIASGENYTIATDSNFLAFKAFAPGE